MCALQPQITFPSIVEICYRLLGRGGAVGAGRELPAHPRVSALTECRVPRRAMSSMGGRGLNVRPTMPTVGAGSSQREDFPARLAAHTCVPCPPVVHIDLPNGRDGRRGVFCSESHFIAKKGECLSDTPPSLPTSRDC